MYQRAISALNKFYGYPAFRTGQWEVIESILKKRDTLAIMPTSAGKSVCYQIPALISPGLCIVISPLIALMKDQVDQLLKRNIPAVAINSSLSQDEIRSLYLNLDDYKFVYVSPERLSDQQFIEVITLKTICFIAVDEAHCISQWGHDFRPAYREIARIREIIKSPVLALTATATPEVADDISKNLLLRNSKRIVKGFDRPNLRWIVLYEHDKLKKIIEICNSLNGCGIIYASTRKAVEEIYQYIAKRSQIKVGFYHGGLESAQRIQIQDSFVGGDYQVLVSTNAFGMGVDKSDVRYVIHYEMSSDLEAYYQEAGRAGRDGNTAYCILLYDQADSNVHEFFLSRTFPEFAHIRGTLNILTQYQVISEADLFEECGLHHDQFDFCIRYLLNKEVVTNQSGQICLIKNETEISQLFELHEQIRSSAYERLNAMIGFCEERRCRRNLILNYFGEQSDKLCGQCDICIGRNKSEKQLISEFTLLFSELLSSTKMRFGVLTICDVLQGKESDLVLKHKLYRNKHYASMKPLSRRYIIRIINQLIDDRILIRSKGRFPILRLNKV